jgi:hypothetical protein
MMLNVTRQMGRDDNILLPPQGVIGRQWLWRCHIKYGATDAFLLQSDQQRFLINQPTAPDVDQQGVGLHGGQFRRANQVVRLRQERYAKDDIIALVQQGWQLVQGKPRFR